MTRYAAILFDLDDTLLDFGRCETAAFAEAHESAHLACPVEEAQHEYRIINLELWGRYRAGEISAAEVRVRRFHLLLERFGGDPGRAAGMAELYIESLGRQCHEVEGCRPLLDSLHGRIPLGIVTNGFRDVQHRRIAAAELTPYFDVVVTSEEAGAAKPSPLPFRMAMEAIAGLQGPVLYVGDSPEADVAGALGAGLEACWLAPADSPYPDRLAPPTFRVPSLAELQIRLRELLEVV
jgi:YjjG family noncanonical pyrimidine nucleotidase